jgi:hypothetical protein
MEVTPRMEKYFPLSSQTPSVYTYYYTITITMGARDIVVVKTLCYKPEGHGLDARWGVNFLIYLLLPSAQALGFTQPLTEMNTRNRKIVLFLKSKARPVRRADNPTTICEPTV